MTRTINISQAYKESQQKTVPKKWKVRKLGDIFLQLGSFSFSRDQMTNEQQKLGYIHYGDIHLNKEKDSVDLKKDKLTFIFDGLIKKERLVDSAFPYLKNGDIILADASEDYEGIGKSWEIIDIDNHKVISGLHTIPLRCHTNEIAVGFGRYLLKNTKSAIALKQVAQGTKVYSISYNHISKLEVLVPPLPEQHKIAEILSVWDRSIDIQTQLIASLQTRKRALMQQLLTRKKRISGFNTPWQTVKLRDVCHRVTRRNSDDNKNVVTISAQKGFVIQTDFFNKSIASEVINNYYLVCKDEFCYNKSYSNGYPMGAIKRLKDFDKAVVTTLYICFKINNTEQTNINFFEQYCENGLLNNGLMKVANEGGRAHGLLNVTPDDFFNLKLSLPLFAEQTAIAERLTTADHEINIAKQRLESLRCQKKGLMQQLLTGKKRVT